MGSESIDSLDSFDSLDSHETLPTKEVHYNCIDKSTPVHKDKVVDKFIESSSTSNPIFTRATTDEGVTVKGSRKYRCHYCSKKINLLEFTVGKCRCDLTFCVEHRMPEMHSCNFDYKEYGQEILTKENPKIESPKVPPIYPSLR